jgi:hypothetical protein
MKSAGNDIVALLSVNKQRTGQFRFYSQILSDYEQGLYFHLPYAGISFENYVWLLWSVKESAYKYLKRIHPRLVFSPTKCVIQYIILPSGPFMSAFNNTHWEHNGNRKEFYSGMLIYESYVFYFRSKISANWIATVVNDNEEFENVFWGIESIDDESYYHQSKEARTLLLNRLSSFFPGDFRVKKSQIGYPIILKGTQNMHISASLAHDDRFVAYSFVLNR